MFLYKFKTFIFLKKFEFIFVMVGTMYYAFNVFFLLTRFFWSQSFWSVKTEFPLVILTTLSLVFLALPRPKTLFCLVPIPLKEWINRDDLHESMSLGWSRRMSSTWAIFWWNYDQILILLDRRNLVWCRIITTFFIILV